MASELQDCPFCGFHPETEYRLLMHMEENHTDDGPSPFVAQDKSSSDSGVTAEESDYAQCPYCDEVVTMAEFDDHVDLHNAEEDIETTGAATELIVNDETRNNTNGYNSPYANSGTNVPDIVKKYGRVPVEVGPVDVENRHSGATDRWRNIFKLPSTIRKIDGHTTNGQRPRKRLGKEELGKYAHEDAMPDWLVALLRQKGQIMQGGIIFALEAILKQSRTTEYAYLCHPAVDHISKLKKEGGFCGYRNIQMLSSYIIGARAEGAHHFNGRLPSIFKIQDYIEKAWDSGINAQGRVETGGVRGTRKYIGTPEAQAMFLSLDIPCNAQGFKDQRPGNAEARLFQHVEQYFKDGDFDPTAKVRRTRLPPVYFQHRGHSLTIVGLEKRRNGTSELLVFDPMFHDSESVVRTIGVKQPHITSSDAMLKLYRRGNKYLKRFHEFEILKLTSRLPAPDKDLPVDEQMGNYAN